MIAGYQADADIDRPLPEILSQHQAATLIENNTIEENDTAKRFPKNVKFKEYDAKEEDPDDKSEKDHPNYGHVDNTKTKIPPKFKHPTKMFNMEMKPAGSSIRLRCAAEGNKHFIDKLVFDHKLRIIIGGKAEGLGLCKVCKVS